ncbi:sialidase family protein [Pseudochryseolinea flava]|uniref:Sialidase domain-containing protein n=1 Tax=Pseudochryseolinea flava TaxID=2059302 RepID=A0A364Y875_9BACT|nr:sialidase family protein [Pseudochryseolinea flava]RAW02549.1 hypothetical protein DQQ10_00055 [Pseudochryseolinea flava]
MKMIRLLALSALFIAIFVRCDNTQREIQICSANAESVYLTHDNLDNPVVAWTEKNNGQLHFTFSISQDDGSSFVQKASILLGSSVATHAEGMPKVAFKRDGTILVAYEKKIPTATNKYAGSIHYRTSEDDGRTWSTEKTIHRDTTSGRSRSYFDIEVLPDGEIGAAWLDIKPRHGKGGRIVLFSKTDATNSFSNEILIDSSACQCCRIDVYTDENKKIYVAYRGLRSGKMDKQIRDMMVATSATDGTKFSQPINISADQWNIDGCPHTGPSLCSNKAGLFTMWYTEGNGSGLYYAHKASDEDNFFPRELVSRAGHHPQVSSNGDVIAMLWEENMTTDGSTATTIHCRLIKDGIDIEKRVLTPRSANSIAPVVTHTKDGFLVACLMENENGVAVYAMNLKL